jgi:LPPG:FO 2-phospho-L-lactate transferase
MDMHAVALAGGVGAGKFLRGLVGVVRPEDVTAVVNTGDDIEVHGLHVSPDLDSVLYWLAGVMDRDRGWGRAGETFRTTGELRRLGSDRAWFGLGDLDLATHLRRTTLLAGGMTLSEATAALAREFEVPTRILPMTDDPVTTRIETTDEEGHVLDLHFQEYWVKRGAQDHVRAIHYRGAAIARPAPGVLEAISAADCILICPSNPIASIDPILAVPGIREAVRERRERVVGISPIVGGAPVRGMADKLLPAVGAEVSASGVAHHYRDLLGAFVIDRVDADLAVEIGEELHGRPVLVVDTMMVDDEVAREVAAAAVGAVMTNADTADGRPEPC